MVLAVTQLHDTIGFNSVVTAGGGGIEVKGMTGELVDIEAGEEQSRLEAIPVNSSEAREKDAKAVITELMGTQGRAKEGSESVGERVGPVLDSVFAVVGLGEDVGKPAKGEVAVGQTLVEMVSAQMLIEDLSDVHATHHSQQQGDVVYPFLFCDNRLWFHPFILAFPLFPGYPYANDG
jgi:hypothetical protein